MQLVEAARMGHAQAIEELLGVCQPDPKRFARRTCSSAEDAEDVVQLVLQLYRKVGALRATATFTVWLFRIVERECFRLFRRSGGPARALRAGDTDIESLAATPLPLDLGLDLSRAIAALPPVYREVLILRDIDELTPPEVAAHLGISAEAVKSRLHRARSMVRGRPMASGYWSKDGLQPDAS